ncbi:MAG: S8 family serine peptidase [Firmicutes bacterium]|nr:S8 family serine peptidase [Bacillota bacterium]
MNITTRKKIMLSIILVLALVFTACIMLFGTSDFTAHASNLQADRDLSADFTIYSTATLADDFEDNLVVVVLSREASRNFGDFTPEHFPEVKFRSVECITPGLDLAVAQTTASISSRANHFYYDSSWTVDLNGFRRILVLELYETGRQNVLDAIRIIERRSDIHSAEPSWNTPSEFIPGSLWGYERILATEAQGFTRGRHTLGTSNVVVGIISLGVDSAHPYFGGRIYQRLSHCWVNDGRGAMTDRNGHGTGIAGIIGGQGDRFTGIAPGIKIASLRVGETGYNSTNVERAVRHAITHNIRVLNVSSVPPRNHVATRTAIRQFPGLMVVSAGNTGHNVNTRYPLLVREPLPNLIVIGAIDDANQRAIWNTVESSNYGTAVCIFAPGDNNRTTAIGGGVRGFGGTSGAAPHVVGAAALMLSTNFQLTGTQMRNAILNNADIIQINAPTIGNHNVRRLNTHRSIASVALLTGNIGITDLSVNGLSDVNAMVQNSTLVIPERFAPVGQNTQRTVTQIGANAFTNNTQIRNLVLPPTVTSIGNAAFMNTSNLEYISFGQNSQLTDIRYNAFDGSRVHALRLPDRVETIRNGAFANNPRLWLIDIGAGSQLRSIGNNAFQNATGLSTIINLSNTSQQVNQWTFLGVDRTRVELRHWSGQLLAFRSAGWDGFRSLTHAATLISDATQLNNIRNNPSGHFRLIRDIDLSGFSNWTPIPNFNGVLDGGGFSISNLNINIPATTFNTHQRFGLFGVVRGTIRNLNFSNANIYGVGHHAGSWWVDAGALTGVTYDAVVMNVSVRDSNIRINRNRSTGGGLIGRVNRSIINDASVERTDIFGNGYHGGVIGYLYHTNVLRARVLNSTVAIWVFTYNRSIGGAAGMVRNSMINNSTLIGVVIRFVNASGGINPMVLAPSMGLFAGTLNASVLGGSNLSGSSIHIQGTLTAEQRRNVGGGQSQTYGRRI